MNTELRKSYDHIRSGGGGFYEQKRGLIAVWGREAVKFLDGLISNDMKTLEDGAQMLAAFPNAQGRLLAVVRVLRQSERILFETEEETREKVFQNLFRFTFAGDFFVEDMSDGYRSVDVHGPRSKVQRQESEFLFDGRMGTTVFVATDSADAFRDQLLDLGAVEISDEVYETLRIENGVPKYGVDMDENTIVPELGLDGLISYSKGCYIGQEIIARIHFRGHVAKRLTGVVSEPGAIATGSLVGAELTTAEGKNAGRITSATYSPNLGKEIALGYVRYDFLAAGTVLRAGETSVEVVDLPFEV
jgi:tRNA-modifying protein YgfZ